MENKKFSSARLIEAQSLKGISNADLAESVGVITDVVSRWRRDIGVPKESNVRNLAEVLDVPLAFFYRSEKAVDLSNKLLRRAKKTRTRKSDDAQRYYLEYFMEGVERIFSRFELSGPQLPVLDLPHPEALTGEDIEEIALKVRRHWGLGGLPIKTLGNLLFSKGIIVQRVAMDWDGVSFVENGKPVILIRDGQTRSRDKTTIAHELGHIVLHHMNTNFDPDSATAKMLDLLEKQAFFFGSCLRMPRETYTKDVYKASYQCLKQIKPKWQAAISAQIMHLFELGCISDEEKSSLFKAASWNQKTLKNEPMESEMVLEECDFLRDAIVNLEKAGERIYVDSVSQIFPAEIAALFGEESSVIVDFPTQTRISG